MKTIALSLLLAVVRSANVFDYDYGVVVSTPASDDYGYDYGGVVVGTPASDIGFAPPDPSDEIPELKDCQPASPCYYGEGDCGEAGDSGCDSDLVCGVNNCADFVPGMAGSCCAQLASSIEIGEIEEFGDWRKEGREGSQWTSWSATHGGWGRQRGRVKQILE